MWSDFVQNLVWAWYKIVDDVDVEKDRVMDKSSC